MTGRCFGDLRPSKAKHQQLSAGLANVWLMVRADVQQADVYAAIAEYDDLGQEGFLEKYKMGKATSYLLRHDDKDYDSKAIFAAAHGHHPGLPPLAADEFSGGADDAAKYLRRLGFDVYSSRGPTWARDEIILACDLVYRNASGGVSTAKTTASANCLIFFRSFRYIRSRSVGRSFGIEMVCLARPTTSRPTTPITRAYRPGVVLAISSSCRSFSTMDP